MRHLACSSVVMRVSGCAYHVPARPAADVRAQDRRPGSPPGKPSLRGAPGHWRTWAVAVEASLSTCSAVADPVSVWAQAADCTQVPEVSKDVADIRHVPVKVVRAGTPARRQKK